MTPDYFDNCRKAYEIWNVSAFICKICRRLMVKMTKRMKELEEAVMELRNKVTLLEVEKETVTEKLKVVEGKADQAKHGLVEVEKEVENGMEKAKEEVKLVIKTEMKEREVRSNNIVVYGIPESNEADTDKRKEHDKKQVIEMMKVLEVETKGEVMVKYRAGKIREDGKGRPMVVKVKEDEEREKILSHARKLSGKPEWKSVFISPDMTWEQREEEKKVEKRLREEAEKKTEDAKKDGKTGGYIVVGRRGARRVVWTAEERRSPAGMTTTATATTT